ncbi:MAG: sigma-54-dependent Fis family transcriptional regulator [Myxococcales bacterium]|nr:sigma-54-dependent Fis family transcriptional regulator [Myxococcales bacterium]
MSSSNSLEERFHAAAEEQIEGVVLEAAMERTGARYGALFVWDDSEKALRLDFHVVDGVVMTVPGLLLRHRADGRPDGIALWVFRHHRPYRSDDTSRDPHYAKYLVDVRSIVAVPILYQRRSIGVLSVSSARAHAFPETTENELGTVAKSAAKFLRRAHMYRAGAKAKRRPFLLKGLSPEWLWLEHQLEQVAGTDIPVLIQGESGTGKELVAHSIHFNSKRSEAPFVSVNCAAIPEQLLESMLFGHVKGAFTGATFNKVGELEKANGGTLFLDEVGDLAPALQAKMLRVLEAREILPVGSNAAPKHIDVRLICATHKNLPGMVRDGTFREDLYYRVGVVTLELPPLRSYKNNLEVIAETFLRRAAQDLGRPDLRLSADALAALEAHDFPGNLRELRNCMEHAAAMAAGDEITAEDLPGPLRQQVARSRRGGEREKTLLELRDEWLAPLERRYLLDLLKQCGGNVREAAGRAGVNTVTLYRLLKRRGLVVAREAKLAAEVGPLRRVRTR